MGADGLVKVDDRPLEDRVRRALGGTQADLVIECAGQPQAWEAAAGLAGRGGRVLLFGGCPGGTRISLDTARIHYDELTLMGSFHFTPAIVARAHELLESDFLELDGLITDTAPLSDIIEVFERLDRGEGLKFALHP
jgi:L-iditol 2-dehydrogenase